MGVNAAQKSGAAEAADEEANEAQRGEEAGQDQGIDVAPPVLGGQTGPNTVTSTVLIYDPATNAWSYGAPLSASSWLLKLIVLSMPAPWIAAELGWIVAEYGRQPWSIGEVLPTALSASSLSVTDVALSLGGFVLFYTALLVADLYLIVKYARLGPSSLGTGRYHFEGARA